MEFRKPKCYWLVYYIVGANKATKLHCETTTKCWGAEKSGTWFILFGKQGLIRTSESVDGGFWLGKASLGFPIQPPCNCFRLHLENLMSWDETFITKGPTFTSKALWRIIVLYSMASPNYFIAWQELRDLMTKAYLWELFGKMRNMYQ